MRDVELWEAWLTDVMRVQILPLIVIEFAKWLKPKLEEDIKRSEQ